MALLNLRLKKIPGVEGIYGKTGNFFPASAALLYPDAADAFVAANAALKVRVSDMLRSAEESMKARQEKRGVQPPGFSGHNFGLAIDIDVEVMLKRGKLTKPKLDEAMRSFGWWCHRRDGLRGMEDWHYNFLGKKAAAEPFLEKAYKTSTAGAVEAKIKAVYGDELVLTPVEMQEALKKMRFYSGAIDGAIGPRTTAALAAFQRAWSLPDTGKMDEKTERTLAFVSCSTTIQE
jgi:hypothetical protein